MKIKKGDIVKIMAGKDKGKQGKVLRVDPVAGKILIEGINLMKKHRRPKKQGEKGEIISLPRFMDVSNVMIICGSCSMPARIGYRVEDGNKFRYCKKCKSNI
ncbi:MAG: 50S ribosomal protein L24 [Patescibacteria group bacterium]